MLSEATRFIMLLFYIGILFIANYFAFGEFLPPATGKGLWFYSGIACILLGNLLVTPFYTKPVDAISYSVIAIIAIYSVNKVSEWKYFELLIFSISLIYFISVIIISFFK